MASRRKASEFENPAKKPKRGREDTTHDENILRNGDRDNMHVPCTCGGIVDYSRFQDMIGRAVQEAFAAAARSGSRRLTPNHCAGIPEAQHLQLRFTNNLKQVYHTQNKILAEGDKSIEIVLFDVESQSIVKTGPMSSAKIEICVLPGDFGRDDHQSGSKEGFNNYILRPREGRKALLRGDTRITLKDGVAVIPKIEITDNSSWQRSRAFRLAAKSEEPNMKEAVSEPFIVMDKRACMKPAQPLLNSEVWRLKHIGKGGPTHKKLLDCGIQTVKDFMRRHTTNPSLLKEILIGNMSSNKWEDIIEHARACVIDDKERYYYSKGQLCFIFNSIYEIVMVSFDNCQTYRSPETLTWDEKHLVEAAKQEAYQNEDFNQYPVDLKTPENPPFGTLFTAGAPPDDEVSQPNNLSPIQQGPEFDWGVSSGSGLHSDPFEAECDLSYLQHLLNSECDVPTSTHGRLKSRIVWKKIRTALKWLMFHRSLGR